MIAPDLNKLGSHSHWPPMLFEGKEKTVAREITITTTGEQELGNIQKSLAVGFDYVFMISSEKSSS